MLKPARQAGPRFLILTYLSPKASKHGGDDPTILSKVLGPSNVRIDGLIACYLVGLEPKTKHRSKLRFRVYFLAPAT